MTPNVTEKLIELTATGGTGTREAALYALGEGADATDEVINVLLTAATTGGSGTREAAIKALGRIFWHK
ncbi:hypothetical protein J8657_00975 [Dickeya oryzae]|uniref:HEAT repeat domain-containing protein n=1 Tax=Dickeya oryzae TaxID=1240404 RepID=A0ABS5B6T4_9GAMM|nr:hypothetical protein [Dickeya oryzae]MBP2856169.1 hypothetical protein [Dickeya oryzae]